MGIFERERELKSLRSTKNFQTRKETTIRGRLNENLGTCFKRLGHGIYIATDGEIKAVFINGDAREEIKQIEDESIDAIIMDSPYTTVDKQMTVGSTREKKPGQRGGLSRLGIWTKTS